MILLFSSTPQPAKSCRCDRNDFEKGVVLLPSLPSGHVEYIRSNGPFECFTSDDAEPGYVVLWALDAISRSNSEVEIEKYAPGFIAFGGNGGGELLAFDSTGAVFMLPMT